MALLDAARELAEIDPTAVNWDALAETLERSARSPATLPRGREVLVAARVTLNHNARVAAAPTSPASPRS
jgi:hypothetical protein